MTCVIVACVMVSSNTILLPEAPPELVLLWEANRRNCNASSASPGLQTDQNVCLFFQRYVEKVSISFRQETTAKIVMKCNAWSFANLDFRGLGKNLSSHRETRRQRSAVSDRIRCYTYKPESFEKQKHPILQTALLWCILTEPRSILRQGKAAFSRSTLEQEDRIIFPWFQLELHALAAW